MLLAVDDLPGKDPPIVLVHGILDAPAAWALVAPRLHATGRRVIVVHSAAHGRSPPPTGAPDWSPQAEGALLAELLDTPAHVVGHSRGATSACWLTVERPDLVASLAVVASPPQATEAFRAHFRRRQTRAADAREESALRYLAEIPDDDFPTHALRRVDRPALVVEYEDDPLYSPTSTLFWRAFLPYADFERVPGGHRAFAESDAAAAWLAQRLLAHVQAAERVI